MTVPVRFIMNKLFSLTINYSVDIYMKQFPIKYNLGKLQGKVESDKTSRLAHVKQFCTITSLVFFLLREDENKRCTHLKRIVW